MNILFVCTGNTCRSPMAEGYLKSKNLPDINVQSRGLAADGSPVSLNSALSLEEKGIDIKNHISKQITLEDLDWADKIICLSPSHRSVLEGYVSDKSKLTLLGNGITDPFGGDLEIYRNCRDEIISAIDKMAENGFFSKISVIPIDREHIKYIAELEKICFSEPWSEETLLDAFSHGTKFFVALAGGEISGYIGISTVLDEGYITNVAVFPEYRRQGVGEALIKRVLSFAEETALSFVSLEVRESNKAAIALYEKYGFKTEGKRRDFYRNPKEDAYIMTKRF